MIERWITLGVSLLALGVSVAGFLVALRARWAHVVLQDFQRTFPGRCPICSFHAYGVREGFVTADIAPPPHRCLEAR